MSDFFAGVTGANLTAGSDGQWTAGTEFAHPSGQFFAPVANILDGNYGTSASWGSDVVGGPTTYRRWVEVDLGEPRALVEWTSTMDLDGTPKIYANDAPMPPIDPLRDFSGAPYPTPPSEGWTQIAGTWVSLGAGAFRFVPSSAPTAAYRYWALLSEMVTPGLGTGGETISEWTGTASVPPAPSPGIDPPAVHDPEGVFIANLDDAFGKNFRVELNGTGQFQFQINRHSPQATALNLARDNVVKFRVPQISPTAIFAGFLEQGDFELVSTDERGGEILTFSGRGLLAYLERDVSWTTSFIHITDPTDGYWIFRPVSATGWSTGNEPGQIVRRLIDEMQDPDRPQHCMSLLTVDFDYATDSDGNDWIETAVTNPIWTVPIGEDVLTTVGRLVATGTVELQMGIDFDLHAYNHFGRDLAGDAFAADVVRFVKGVNIVERVNRKWKGAEIAPYALTQGTDIYIRADLPDAASRVPKVVFVQTDATGHDPTEAAGLADLEQRLANSDGTAFKINVQRLGGPEGPEDGRYLPGPVGTNGHFWVGDTVRMHTGTDSIDFNEEDVRVTAITISEDEAANLIVIPEFGYATGEINAPGGVTYGGGGIAQPPGGTTGGGTTSHGLLGGRATDGQHPASAVTYENATSGLTADDVQAAIDEIVAMPGGGSSLDWIIVTDYGAVGDDSADDTSAIQDALDATPVGGVCYFPVPSVAYKITSALTIPHAMTLKGGGSFIGQYTKILQHTANTDAIVGPSATSADIVVEGLQITGQIGGQSSGAGIKCNNSVLVSRCLIQGFYDGLRITSTSPSDAAFYSSVEYSFFDSATRAGIALVGIVNNFGWRDCRASSNAYGIYVPGHATAGGPESLRFLGGAVELNTTAGIWIDGTGGGSQDTSGVLIAGMYLEHADGVPDILLGANTVVHAVDINGSTFVKSGLSGSGWHIDAQNVVGLTVTGNEWMSSDALRAVGSSDEVVLVNNRNRNAGTVTVPAGSVIVDTTSTTPSPNGVAAAGTSAKIARADHVHADSGGGAGRWELAVITGSPPDPLYADGDFLYIFVP